MFDRDQRAFVFASASNVFQSGTSVLLTRKSTGSRRLNALAWPWNVVISMHGIKSSSSKYGCHAVNSLTCELVLWSVNATKSSPRSAAAPPERNQCVMDLHLFMSCEVLLP